MRNVPASMADRLIVALDVTGVDEARALVAQLSGTISFFKIGLGLIFAPGVDRLIDDLIGGGNRVFLDAKMYDIPETVTRGIAVAASRGVSLITIHGEDTIIQAATAARGVSKLQIFAVTVLTSLDDAALARMGSSLGARALVEMRARQAAAHGCDGIIASAHDIPNEIRALSGNPDLLIATPGVRQSTGALNDHKRSATPAEAIRNGSDYLVVGRPIIKAENPSATAETFIAEMESAASSAH
jgi:orotidine-5'-phosphate decarboxylase